MTEKEFEMPDEYKRNLAHLAQFLEDRERYRQAWKDASVVQRSEMAPHLRSFDDVIETLEKGLAEEYDRYQAERAKEAELEEALDKGEELSKHLYIIIKHQNPHLLQGFEQACLGPLTPEMREAFLDDVAVLKSTKLDAILSGKA